MRAMVSYRTKPKKTGTIRAKGQSSQSAARTAGGKGVPLLEDGDLDTGGLPINALLS